MRLPHRPASPDDNDAQLGGTVSPDTSAAASFGIRADLLIPGRGEPLRHAVVVVTDDKIAWVGPRTEVPARYSSLSFRHVPVLMPGLWDVHTHFMGIDVVASLSEPASQFLPGFGALVGAVTVDDLRATLMSGFTSVRELGGYAGDVAPAVRLGAIPGPNVYSSFAVLSITGGHGDQHEVPLQTVLDSARAGGLYALCDGPDECVKTVRTLVRRGAKVIKVCSTGGVLSLNDQPEDTQFSPAELKAIVDEAARSGRVVAAHAIGKNGIMNALRAGVKTIEHGMYLDEEVTALMKEKGAIYVPTRRIVEFLVADPSGLPPRIVEKIMRMRDLARAALRLAVREGVKIALGTDTGSSDRKSGWTHGGNAVELRYAVEAGMTPLQAVEMGTAVGPETLGPQGPQSGQIKAGYDADIIAVTKSPLDDIEVLLDTANVTHVWKGGKLFKSR